MGAAAQQPGAEIAPGVVRLGDAVVNYYLVEQVEGPVLVDAGLPGHRKGLERFLAASGRSVADVRAVLLTHAHPDHTGLLAPLRKAGAEIWVHEKDAPILRDGPRSAMRHAKPQRSMLGYLARRPSAAGTPLHMGLKGGFTAPAVSGARTFAGPGTLDSVPGRPEVVALPGHTGGSVGFRFPGSGVLFTGDALVTYDGLTGHRGPTLVCEGFTQDGARALASLETIAELGTDLLLPGHGDPVTDPSAAVLEAQRRGLR